MTTRELAPPMMPVREGHLQSVSETEGGAEGDWKPSGRPCRHRQVAGQRYTRVWESDDGACTDEKNECRACGEVWWVEGSASRFAGGWSSLLGQAAPDLPLWTFTARPLIDVVSACGMIASGALRGLARGWRRRGTAPPSSHHPHRPASSPACSRACRPSPPRLAAGVLERRGPAAPRTPGRSYRFCDPARQPRARKTSTGICARLKTSISA